ncbi:MAG: CheY-like chemotaxis protein [Planctomycetota bacterium]|jgi:CheY-like chemotaxis protein
MDDSKANDSDYSTVLIVDDEAVVLNVARQIFARAGFKVIEASTGQDAIDIFEARKDEINLVFLDHRMPGMCGDEVFAVLREMSPRLPVLLTSGLALEDLGAEILGSGPTVFLAKPYRSQILIEKAHEALALK